MRVLALSLLSASVLIANPVQAQSKKELAAQNAVLAQRLTVLENRLLTGDPAAERLMQRMDGLEASVRNLTGEVERLRYERDSLSSEAAALAEDIRAMQELSTRMRIHLDAVDLVNSETRSPSTARTYGGANSDGSLGSISSGNGYSDYSTSGLAGEPTTSRTYGDISPGTQLSQVPAAPVYREATIPVQQDYNDLSQLPETGKRKLSEGDFLGAQTAFKQYLEFKPEAPDAGEINFWLGETYFVRGGYNDAADAYIGSMRKAPNGPKAPDAMIRLAATLNQLGNQAEACQTLASFPGQFPNANASLREKARIETTRAGC